MDSDSLVATRARRANAGSKLKQLIQMEELAEEVKRTYANDDDENVELLFQEDENDEEFENSDEEEEGGEEEEQSGSEDQDGSTEDANEAGPSEQETSTINQDEMFSDSDLSATDDDESEGERELEREEKNKRKKRQKTVIQEIKRPKKTKAAPSAPKQLSTSEVLLSTERRVSSRKSALKSKEALMQRMRDDEMRRASFTPIKRKKERELTQAERLAQAVETEKANLISLNLFLEQEIMKKEKQKSLAQLKRPPLRNVIRLHSYESFVSPNDEVLYERRKLGLLDKKLPGKRRRYLPEDFAMRYYGDINPELPYYKQEMIDMRKQEYLAQEERRKRELKETEKRVKAELDKARAKALNGGVTPPPVKTENDTSQNGDVKGDRKVTFADDKKDESEDESDEEIFEGPEQRVCRNFVILLDFDDQDRYHQIPEHTTKIALFGEDGAWGGSRKFRDVRTIFKSTSKKDSPFAKDENEIVDERFVPVTKMSEDSSVFDELYRLRKIGTRIEEEEEIIFEEEEDEDSVNIRTDAPTGLFLPNGNKKICVISGNEVKFFDLITGIPYDTPEDYRVIKSIEQGEFPWLSIPKDQNTYGHVEMFLGHRVDLKHAKGVPEGFGALD